MPKTIKRHFRRYSPHIDATMREVLHTLGDIDFAAAIELEKLEARALDPKSQESIKGTIKAAHQARRQPYVDLLETLRRQQHRQSLAA